MGAGARRLAAAVVSTGRATTAGGGAGAGLGAGFTVSRAATGGAVAAARPPLAKRPGAGVTILVVGRTTVSAGARPGVRDVSRRAATGGGPAAGGPGTGGAGVTATRAEGAAEDMNRT